MAERTFKPKPLVDANQVTEYGAVELTPEFMNEGAGHGDYLYVPGGSDMRYARDCEQSRAFRGEIRANEVKPLEWNPRWFRTVKGAGSDPDNTRMVHAKIKGYRPATKDDIGKPWLTDIPPGGMVAPDGTIKTSGGDLALFIADQATAAKNAMKKKIRTEESIDGMQFRMDGNEKGLGVVGKNIKGADPYVETHIGQEATK